MRARKYNNAWCVAFAIGLAACAQSKLESKNKAAAKPTVTGTPKTAEEKPGNIDIAEAKYDMTIYTGYGSASQNAMCNGEVSMMIRSQFGGLAPKGVINCTLIGQLDLGKMMPDAGDLEELTPAELKKLKAYGQIARVPNPKSKKYAFTPPLPIVIGPLIQNAEEFANYKFSESIKVSFNDPNVDIKEDSGGVRYEVIEHKTSFPMANRKYTFDDVIHYKREVIGFNNVKDRGTLMLYPMMEFWYNAQPVAIPQIVISASPSQVAGLSIGPVMAAFADILFDKLTIVLSLKEHKELEK